jgi:biopolymer transport protein ExbD
VVRTRAGHPHRRWRISEKKHHVDPVRNDINVTPLVDVMLVLLIIFMVMTLIMGRGHDVTLPRAHNNSESKDTLQPIVTIACANKELCDQAELYVEKDKIGPIDTPHLMQMRMNIEAGWKAHPPDPTEDQKQRVFVKADEELTFKDVQPVLLYLNKEVGLAQIDLAVAKAEEK